MEFDVAKNQEQNQQESPLAIRDQYIKDLSFENPNPFLKFEPEEEGDPQPNINVNIEASAQNLAERVFEVTLNVKVEATRKNKTLFLTELSYSGIASVSDEIKEEKVPHAIMVDVPSFLFPFAREIVANTTRAGGFPPIFLSPVDFQQLYQQQSNKAQ